MMWVPEIKTESVMWKASALSSPTPRNTILKRFSSSMFTEVQFKKVKIWKQSKCPRTDEWLKKLVCIHYGILQQDGLMESTTMWMETKGIMMRKVSQIERDKCKISISFVGYKETQ